MFQLYRRFMAYLNKENFDCTQGYVDSYEYHKNFMLVAKLFNVMDIKNIPWYMYILPGSVAATTITAAILFFISLTWYIRNLQIFLITECGTYFAIMCYSPIIVSCTFFEKKHYYRFIKGLQDDFDYICTTGVRYREKFFINQKKTFKASVLTSFFIAGNGTGISIFGCISAMIAALSSDRERDRPLPYPYWFFNYDLSSSPVYEILIIFSIMVTFLHTFNYTFMMTTEIVWVRHVMCKADVIIWSIQDLLEDVHPAKNDEEREYYAQLIHSRMKEIITMHHSMFSMMEDFAAVFKKCILYEQKLSGPLICMSAYCFAEKLDADEFQGILLLLCCSMIGVVFVPCYLCTLLLEKVQSVSGACWDMPFWDAGPVIRPYVLLIMQRSMRQLPIVAAGFEDISLQTYANIITGAYSCYNMLRQSSSSSSSSSSS